MRAVYKATFNAYTNTMKDTIHNPKTDTYRTVHNGEKIILDVNINKYMDFGNGFKTLEFLGYIAVEDIKTEDDTFIIGQEISLLKNTVIEARRCLNSPFLWGGDTLNGFDNSGLIYYIYQQVGIGIPRHIQGQSTFGKEVIVGIDNWSEELQEGDVLFFGENPTNLYHVAIYIGGRDMIEATKSGEKVKITKVDIFRDDFTMIRRYISNDV